jgi:alkylation response protein AidB-like acyl-CoA dehydrogenase
MTSRDVQETHRVDAGGELVERAREAAAVLAANAEKTEQGRRPAAESIAAVRDAGLFALTVPVEFGGLAASPRLRVLVLAELGRACPSTAWVTAISAGGKQVFLQMLPEQARAEVFADPDVIVCGSGGPAGATGVETGDGLRISGRWRLASGCEEATWAILMVPVVAEGEPVRLSVVLVPTADLAVDRDWRAVGMAGTGTHSLVAEDVVVPPGRVRALGAVDKMAESIDPTLMLRSLPDLLAGFCGAAQGALEVVDAAFAGDRAPYMTTYQRMVQSPLARHWFAEATQLVDTAYTRALSVADTLDMLDVLGADAVVPIKERSRLRMELVTAATECRQAVEMLLDLHGMSGFVEDNRLQRFWRDIAVGTRHPQLNRYITVEDYGRVLLDAEPPVAAML